MADFNIDRFEEMATLIISLQENDDVQDDLNEWIAEYSDYLRKAAALKDGTEQEKRIANAIAKSLPAIATGIQSAVKGFQAGNPLLGSAAVVDVVGNMVTMISSMVSSAAGPPGAVVGSILSVFSMILRAFSQQKPEKSIEEKLQNVIDVHDAQELTDTLQAIQDEINTILEQFRIHNKDKQKFSFGRVQKSLDIENKGLLMTRAGKWIHRNQDIQHWEAVLAAHCYAHIGLMQAITLAMNIVKHEEDIQYLKGILDTRNARQLLFIQNIKPAAQNQGTIWAALCRNLSSTGSSFVLSRKAVVSDKKDWQRHNVGYTPISFAVSDRTHNSEGQSNLQFMALFTVNNTYPFSSLKDWDRNNDTLLNHPFRKEIDGGAARGIINAWYGNYPLRADAKKHTMVPFNTDGNHDFYDIWAIPGHRPGEIDLYTAEGDKIVFWRQGAKAHTAGEETKLLFRGGTNMPEGYKVGAVRASILKPFDDEGDILSKDVIHGIYGACEVKARKSKLNSNVSGGLLMPPYFEKDHMEIEVIYRGITWVNGHLELPKHSRFVAPWQNFVGLAIDSHYLWVFKAGAIACATHTEIYNSLLQGRTSPPWMVYNIPKKVGEIEYDPNELFHLMGNYYRKGLLDLSSCEDGTLTAVFCELENYRAPIFAMKPIIDRKARTLKIEGEKRDPIGHKVLTSGWKSDRTRFVSRVIKHPISCWPILSGLEKVLESQLNPK